MRCLTALAFASALGALPVQSAAAQNSEANTSYKPGDPVIIDSAKIIEQSAAQQQAQQTAQPEPPKEAAPRELIAQTVMSLKITSEECQNSPKCPVRNRIKILRSMNNAMEESLMRLDGVCDSMNYDGCITAQRTEIEDLYSMNGHMRALMQTMAPLEARDMLLSANPAAELNNIQPAAGDPLAGAPPTAP